MDKSLKNLFDQSEAKVRGKFRGTFGRFGNGTMMMPYIRVGHITSVIHISKSIVGQNGRPMHHSIVRIKEKLMLISDQLLLGA